MIAQSIQIMAKTRIVRESNWILNSCSCLWEHSMDKRKADLLL